jgi:hypothetical protein
MIQHTRNLDILTACIGPSLDELMMGIIESHVRCIKHPLVFDYKSMGRKSKRENIDHGPFDTCLMALDVVGEGLRALRSAGCQHTTELEAILAPLSREYHRLNEYFAPYLKIPALDAKIFAQFSALME